MEKSTKHILYVCCGAAGLSFLLAIWSFSLATRARTRASLAEKRVGELDSAVSGAKEKARKGREELGSKLNALEESANELSKKIDALRAGRDEAKEYANRKNKDALDMLEERLRAFGQERDQKLKAFSGEMEKARKQMEKGVEDRCKKLKDYVNRRLLSY